MIATVIPMPARPPSDARLRRTVAEAVDALVTARREPSPEQVHLARAVAADRLAAVAERLARAEVEAARQLGASWREVGDAFGVIRQTAHERFSSGPDGPRLRPSRSRAAQSRASDSGSTG
jgi:hypothetical protein